MQRLTALSGPLGFVFVAYVVFVVIYGVLVSLTDDAPVVRDAVMTVLMASCAVLALGALGVVVAFTFARGWDALRHLNFYTQDMSKAGPLAPLKVGGMGHALVGTVWMVGIAVILTVPLGLVAAVYLDMTRSRPARFFRTVVEAMTALPSILAGLFIYASWILAFGFQRSGLAAALALSVMMLPYIVRAADLALRLVPNNLREASAALGAPGWRGEMQVVLPTARSGLATAVILGIARSIGEASPVLLTAGYTTYINANPLQGAMVSLPLETLELVQLRYSRLHHPGLRLRLVPPPGDHRPVRRRPQDRRVGTGASVPPGTASGGGRLGSRRGQVQRETAAPVDQGLGVQARIQDRGGRLMTKPRSTRRGGDGTRVRVSGSRVAAAIRVAAALAAAIVAVTSTLVAAGAPAGATAYVPVSGEGSSWSANAINQWIADVQQDGMRVNYTANGSTTGREDWIKGLTDFAASDIPFQTDPKDGSAPENPQPGSYAYMPITAGGTVFMYNLKIDGQQVTNLRLSGENIAKIFTGVITNWDNPALAADNPGLKLPDQTIVPVVRSDGAGSSYELSEWMISQYPSLWSSFCSARGRAPACGPTSFYPTPADGIAQSGDLGVAGYVSQAYADGSIGYVEYSYALNDDFPVVQMLNAAGYYTEPTAQNVAVSLLAAQVDTSDPSDPATYLTENLSGVYTDPDPRTYPLSSYSYLILPTKIEGQFNAAEGTTLAAFSYYAMCQGQQQSASFGYSPMPINLVEDSFAQITKIPGAVTQNIDIQSCNNPTFTPSGANLLAQTAPYPPACDKQGPTQCVNGTGGASATITVVSGNPQSAGFANTGPDTTGTGGSSSEPGTSSSSGGSGPTATAGTGPAGKRGSRSRSAGSQAALAAVQTCVAKHPHDVAACADAAAATASAGTNPTPDTETLAVTKGWSVEQTLILLIALALIALILVPGGLLSRRLDRRRR